MKLKEKISPGRSEAELAYSNDRVIAALKSSDWFTTALIESIHDNEPEPERKGLGPFEDETLGDFLNAELGKESEVFRGVRSYLLQRMVGGQGHPLPLKRNPFADEAVLEVARRLGVDENYEIDRGKIGEVGAMLQCMIAPEPIRKKVIRVNCIWGSERTKRDTLLWADLVRKGSKSYFENRGL